MSIIFWTVIKFITSIILGILLSIIISLSLLYFLGEESGLHYFYELCSYQLEWLKNTPHLVTKLFNTLSQFNFIENNLIKNIITAIILSVSLCILRLSTAILFLPLFILFGLVGLTDGLVQRYLRRLGGGRESALIYHLAKQYIFVCITFSIFIYLVLPFKFQPEVLFLPFSIMFGLLISVAIRTFKKYI